MFEQRLTKRLKHLKKFASRWPTNAFRVYDRDIPDYPWMVDVYAEHVLLQFYETQRAENQLDEIPQRIAAFFEIPIEQVHVKIRRRRPGTQHEKHDVSGIPFTVFEGPHQFWVDLDSYIDTGLFLDHRNLRREVGREVEERVKSSRTPPKVLNLFCYTGTFSVWAAAAGAHVTSVDLSNTYLEWAEKNFELNNLKMENHVFERSDVTRWLPQQRTSGIYDIVVLDPPSWSRSKKMDTEFDVQRDHVFLIKHALRLLKPGGVLHFSTNLRNFKLDQEALDTTLEETTHWTLPEDFREGIHRSFKALKK